MINSDDVTLPNRFVYRDERVTPKGDVMEFKLTYQGKLTSTRTGPIDGKAAHKHDIRQRFHKQLKRWWGINPVLIFQAKASGIDEVVEAPFRWAPLVKPGRHMNCSISILYLRNGARGYVLSNADIDNRIKTLIDALKMPRPSELPTGAAPAADENPFFVLLSDDNLVTHLSVETDVLLEPTDPQLDDLDSRCVISVKLWN